MIDPMYEGATCKPREAKVAYAAAMSTTCGLVVPSVKAKVGSIPTASAGLPARFAALKTVSKPTVFASST